MAYLKFVLFTFFYLISVSLQEDVECVEDADCEIELSTCVNSSCVCPPDFIPNDVYTKCLKVVHNYGESCTDSLQCSTSLKSGGNCNNGSCSCQNGYHYLKGECWKSLGLGDKCKKSENCWVGNDFESSICDENKICVCTPGYYQREHSSCRRESYKPGDPCGIALDCKFENAECTVNRTCQYKNTVHINLLEEEITQEINLQTLVISAVGDNCKSSSDCPKNSYCSTTGLCLCNQGFYTLDQKTCFPELGSKCENNSDCLGKNTMCRDAKYCTCKEGFVTSKDGKYCDKLSRFIGWSCLRDEQCSFFGPNSICLNKKCNCNNESYYIDDQMFCWGFKKNGEKCMDDRDCGIGNVTCANGLCACKPGNHPSSQKDACRIDSDNFGDKCVESLDCVFNFSSCNTTSKQCICQNGYIKDGNKCKPGIGGECVNNQNCTVEKSHCFNSTCMCDKDYISSLTYDSCMPLTRAYEGKCDDSVQCSQLDADCMTGLCKCRAGMHYAEGWKCYLKANIYQNCTRNGQCYVKNSQCYRGYCACKPGYHTKYIGYNQTICTNEGGNCTRSSQCYVKNTQCYRGYCICRPGYHTKYIGYNQYICTNGGRQISVSFFTLILAFFVTSFYTSNKH